MCILWGEKPLENRGTVETKAVGDNHLKRMACFSNGDSSPSDFLLFFHFTGKLRYCFLYNMIKKTGLRSSKHFLFSVGHQKAVVDEEINRETMK